MEVTIEDCRDALAFEEEEWGGIEELLLTLQDWSYFFGFQAGGMDMAVDECPECGGKGRFYIVNVDNPDELKTVVCEMCGGVGRREIDIPHS